jgi:ribosomal protein L37AE/L43A
MPEDIPISTDKKCPACASTAVHEVAANIGTGTRNSHVAHLWSCEKCRNAFRLVEATGDQRDPHFDL